VVPPCSDRISRVPPYSRINWHLRIRGYHPLWPDFPDRFAYLQLTTGLFRVRSPLLAESLLMSFPPGTEMFQFPGFASTHYVFMCRYRLRGGLPHSDIHGSTPARGSPWLFAACHVLHRLLVPRHPPNALLILDIPVWTVRFKPHHAQKPSSGYEGWSLEILVFSATQHDLSWMAVSLAARATMEKDPSARIVHRASEPSLSNRWGAIDGPNVSIQTQQQQFPVRQVGRTAGPPIHP
jgi:hypothetical protein